MGEHSKMLHYNKNNSTHDIKLYTSTDDVGEHYISINDGGMTVYAALIGESEADASDIRVRLNGTTYAVATQYSSIDLSSEAGLLLQRTRAGTHTQYYNVGDYFEIKLNGKLSDGLTMNNETYRAVIVGFDHNKDLETGGQYSTTLALCQDTSGTQIAFVDSKVITDVSSGSYFAHHLKSETNAGGWSASNIRNSIMPNFFNALPTAWQNVIGTVTKYTDNVANGSTSEANVTATSEKLFLPSEYEISTFKDYSNSGESSKQQRYSYFNNWRTDSTLFARKRHNNVKTNVSWWTRSPYPSKTNQWASIVTNYLQNTNGYRSLGIVPFFNVF